ncbi:MAG: rod shape-determining protein MreD [Defluviitaleaceae bacterium]|nr:rod shape-determining protein MreD [Defluviitaleaceae bacterium]MCL2240046.1 rod shape-determining protein MreD [Defluviitaleaceae bacterium]
MLRVAVLTVLILTNYVLQTTLWPELAILGVTPDTALIFIVSYGMLRGEIEGGLFGFAAGFLMDIFGGVYMGVYALLGFVIGYISGKPFKSFFKDNYFLPFFVVLVFTVAYQFVLYIVNFMFRGQLDFWFYVYSIILPKTVYTAALAIPLYTMLHFINRRVEDFENRRRHLFEEKEDD